MNAVSGPLHIESSWPRDLDGGGAASALVTIAGSAGAFPGLCRVLAELPLELNAAVVAILHTGAGSALASALAMRSRLVISEATSGGLLRDGRVYVAPPLTHLLVNLDGRLTVVDAPRAGVYRPSADWLFESAASSFTSRHVAVVLSGLLSDGARQLSLVKRLGGTVLAEDPSQAAYSPMPAAAIATGHVDVVVAIEQMALAICAAVRQHAASARVWESPFEASS